jgi:hypothetical protein
MDSAQTATDLIAFEAAAVDATAWHGSINVSASTSLLTATTINKKSRTR